MGIQISSQHAGVPTVVNRETRKSVRLEKFAKVPCEDLKRDAVFLSLLVFGVFFI